ncbi:hypothetical protein ACTXPS_19900 [Brachybacterium tyrofermentans]|uniref:hypothetical protein n=1 Tax=Brachybacterium tyrofermentans TaxID=47848 RepID=UPI003FD6BFE3
MSDEDDQAAYDALYGKPPAPEYTPEEQADYDAVYGTAQPAALTDDEQQLYDYFFPGNTAD